MQSEDVPHLDRGLAGQDVLALAAHEMRQSLTVIGGLAGVLRAPGRLGGMQARITVLSTIEHHIDLLSSSVEDLLDIARAEAGQLKLDVRCLRASLILRQTIDRARVDHQNHVIVVRSGANNVLVRVDGRRISQVLANLIRNAARSAPARTEIRIECDLIRDDLVISVTDQGAGIPADMKAGLFERFPEAASHRGSVGLGLYLCRRIVEAHGGRIWSETTDEGATFRFLLPISAEEHAV